MVCNEGNILALTAPGLLEHATSMYVFVTYLFKLEELLHL